MSLTADLHCEIREVGGHWWPIATFQLGSARRFRQALHGAGLADRGLPLSPLRAYFINLVEYDTNTDLILKSSKGFMKKTIAVKKGSEAERNNQLEKFRREVDFDTYDMSISEITSRIRKGSIDMAPIYQRNFRWDVKKQSLFIESLFLDIPIPVIFVAKNLDNKWEVIDGAQRLHTILHFMSDQELLDRYKIEGNLVLSDLEKLTTFNNISFNELNPIEQDLFNDQTLRVIALTRETEPSVRFDLFERINKGAAVLTPQEIRACVYVGRFMNMVEELSSDENFKRVVKLPEAKVKEALRDEFVLRFIALAFKSEFYNQSPIKFLNQVASYYAKDSNFNTKTENEIRKVFYNTFAILSNALPNGIVRAPKKSETSPAIFEAISVGSAKALINRGTIKTNLLSEIINSQELGKHLGAGSNSSKKLQSRIAYVYDRV